MRCKRPAPSKDNRDVDFKEGRIDSRIETIQSCTIGRITFFFLVCWFRRYFLITHFRRRWNRRFKMKTCTRNATTRWRKSLSKKDWFSIWFLAPFRTAAVGFERDFPFGPPNEQSFEKRQKLKIGAPNSFRLFRRRIHFTEC